MKRKDRLELIKNVLSRIPRALRDSKLLILMYWKLVDGIEIPPEIAAQIVIHGTSPETITRDRRRVMEALTRNGKAEVQTRDATEEGS